MVDNVDHTPEGATHYKYERGYAIRVTFYKNDMDSDCFYKWFSYNECTKQWVSVGFTKPSQIIKLGK